jgi:hypothetical protein
VAAEEPTLLAQQARDVLNNHCQRCHSADGKAKGGFDYVTQLDRLVARNKVVPGRPVESEVFQKVRDGDMPPRSQKTRPSKDELAILERWIAAGASSGRSTTARRFLTEGDVVRAIRADLDGLPERQRRFFRYFTLAALSNAGRADEELDTLRHGLAKLVNCLSWQPRITRPVAVDEAALLYRIDLRDYKWNARQWDKLVAAYPYRVPDGSPAAKDNGTQTGSEQPYLRADWFVATASRAPLYYDLLQMPGTDRGLERLLQVDVPANIQEESIVRAGFNGSGVSKNNRVLERHDAGYGAYWRTYDFSDNTERQNIFDHPLGPSPGPNGFVPAGGEAIFHLPNGLHGYLLLDGNGRRVDRASVDIVSDPQRPDRAVEAGLSCMACHARGFLPKADQVRAHVLKNAAAFPREQVEAVKALYSKDTRFRGLLDEDNERYLKALAETGVSKDGAEPINAITLRYEAVVDLVSAAAEAGLKPDEFQARLSKSAALNRVLGPLQVKGGTVQRQTFQTAFPDLVRELKLGEDVRAVATAEQPFTGHTAAVLCIAFSRDGKRALSGSEDRSVRLWDVESGKEIRRFEGHTSAVSAVAFVGANTVLSGGHDRTLRLWDVETGKELLRLVGHTDKVTSVDVHGTNRAVSGSQDRTLRCWDIDSGKELSCLSGHTGWVNSVAFDESGQRVLSGSHDGTVRIWQVESGKQLRLLEGHTRAVHSVAWSSRGTTIASGGNDRTIRLWKLDGDTTGQRILEGHQNAVIRVAFVEEAPFDKVLSGSSQYQKVDPFLRRWQIADGKPLAAFGGGDERVSCVAFSRDGRRALTDGPNYTLRLWKLDESK